MSRRRLPLTPERVAQLRACPAIHVRDAMGIYGMGRNRLYALMKSGDLRFKKIATSTLLSVEDLLLVAGFAVFWEGRTACGAGLRRKSMLIM
jgi:hypothetical protein